MLIEKVFNVDSMAEVSGDITQLKRELTVKVIGYDNTPETTLILYQELPNGRLRVPRALVQTYGVPVSNDKFLTTTWESNIVLRPEQVKYIEAFRLHLNTYGCIIKAPTGSGKTVLGLYIAHLLQGVTLIIVPLTSLVKQWKQRILEYTNIKEDEIGLIQGSVCNYQGKKIVIAMLHSLAQKEYPKEMYSIFKTVIVDEVHTIGAPTFSTVIGKFPCMFRLGLSATPRRKDGAEKVFLYHIGKVVATDTFSQIVPKIIKYSYEGADSAETPYTTPYGKFLFSRYLNKIASSAPRNQTISELVAKSLDKDRSVLILTDRLQQIYTLRNILLHNKITDVSIWTGDIKESHKQVILATYGSAGMGVDIPQLDTLIFATPRVDVEQAVGRLLRVYEDKKAPVVIDIVDVKSKHMMGYSRARDRLYKKLKFEVVYA